MAVGLSDVRTQIADQPRLCVRPGQYEPIASPADGATTAFGLLYSKAILSTVRVFKQVAVTTAAQPPANVPVLATDSALGWIATTDANGLPTVQFQAAPPQGTVLLATYQVVAFTDLELTNVLLRNMKATDQLTLLAVHIAIIPSILTNREAMMVYRINDRSEDPGQFARSLSDLRKQMIAELQADVDEDAAAVSGSMHGGFGGSPFGSFGSFGW